jgi:hypothetical protein
MIDGPHYFSRRVVVAKIEGHYTCGKFVYDFQAI